MSRNASAVVEPSPRFGTTPPTDNHDSAQDLLNVENSDRALMLRIREAHRGSLQCLIDRYQGRLLAYVAERVRSRDDAEDIVQEVFVRVWRHRAQWSPSGAVSAYLYRIARNLTLNAVRHRRAQQKWDRITGEELFRSMPLRTADETLEEEELREEVECAIASLPERRREIFVLARFHRLSHREIAETLGISPQTVANQMGAALADLRKALRHRLEDRP